MWEAVDDPIKRERVSYQGSSKNWASESSSWPALWKQVDEQVNKEKPISCDSNWHDRSEDLLHRNQTYVQNCGWFCTVEAEYRTQHWPHSCCSWRTATVVWQVAQQCRKPPTQNHIQSLCIQIILPHSEWLDLNQGSGPNESGGPRKGRRASQSYLGFQLYPTSLRKATILDKMELPLKVNSYSVSFSLKRLSYLALCTKGPVLGVCRYSCWAWRHSWTPPDCLWCYREGWGSCHCAGR